MYDHGIGVTGGSSMDFELAGVWSRLTGLFAVDRDTYGHGRAVFRVLGEATPCSSPGGNRPVVDQGNLPSAWRV